MLSLVVLTCIIAHTASQITVSREAGFKEIVGINAAGDTVIYNGLIVKHWVKTQRDELKISKADVNPVDGQIYAVEQGSAVVYRKPSFSHSFVYVDCCANAFTFVDTPIEGLPNTVKLLVIDGNTLFALKHFNDRKGFSMEVDLNIVDIASVAGVVAALSDKGRLYKMSISRGAAVFKDVTGHFSRKFEKMTSISAWRKKGLFLGTSEIVKDAEPQVWQSSTTLMGWESFGSGRSCCVASVFEVPKIESFSEQLFPFCTQVNVESVPTSSIGTCAAEEASFGTTVYRIVDQQSTVPCVEFIDSATIFPTAQDLLSDYKIVIKAAYKNSPSKIGVAFNLRDEDTYDYVYIDPANRKDCWGMGHMTKAGPVAIDLNTGCPGGPPLEGVPFTLEIRSVERQVIVKHNGYQIFSRYPHYENIAAGGLMIWSTGGHDTRVTTYGFGICYVPSDNVDHVTEVIDPEILTEPNNQETPTEYDRNEIGDNVEFGSFTDEYSSPGADVSENTREFTTATLPTTGTPTTPGGNIIEVTEDPALTADASIILISGGIEFKYYLYMNSVGFSAANRACEKKGMSLLLTEDEIQNSRIASLLAFEGVEKVWLGKFWIEGWEITLVDGTPVDWHRFESKPAATSAPVFAALRSDGVWDAVQGGDRFYYVCQKAVDVNIWDNDRDFDNEVREFIKDDEQEIKDSFEETIDHAPVIVKGPIDVTAQEGDTVTFKCTASSKPPPTVIIVKIDNEDAVLPTIGDASQLNDDSQRVTTIIELEKVTEDDAGKYACIAQNEMGEASASAWLIIEKDDFLQIPNSCMLWGDPHITTFDEKLYNFPGVCTYILAMDCVSSSFWIYGLLKECGGAWNPGPSLSALDSVTIYARVSDGNQTGVELQRGWVVNIGGAKLRISEGMSARHGNLIIRRTAEHVFVTLPNKITVQWDGLHMAVISLPHNFDADKTCGLCGKFNGDPSDDFYMRYGHTDMTTNPNVFGNSWAFPTYFRPCDSVPEQEVNPCHYFPDRDTQGSRLCQIHLYQVPFTTCHQKVDPTPYYENCRKDYCGSEWRREDNLPLCNALSAYATACQIKGRPISSWRSVSLCPIDEIKEITKEEGCPWDELEFDFDEGGDGERDTEDN